MISLVYAQDLNGGIGYKNDLPWNLPNDLKFFKRMTMGHTMIMGRKTFESMGCRLLPGRETIVVTRDSNYGKSILGLKVINDPQEVITLATQKSIKVIGGAALFKAILPYADEIVRTLIHAELEADTFMPDINQDEWELVKVEQGIVDEKSIYPHEYQWWERRKDNL